MPVIEIERLRKTYGELVAVDDLSLFVEAGEIFGIVGPNGAGKTTTVECVAGLRVPDSGTLRILGLDPRTAGNELRQRVGVQLQQSELPAKLRPREALEMFGSFYREPLEVAGLVDALGLGPHLDSYFKELSGGLRQRLSIALALVGRPEVAMLDELTTGLDPHARRETWELIESVRSTGVTVVVVTHSMEEAEQLCDRVAIVDHGRLIACGSPNELTELAGSVTRLTFLPSAPFADAILTHLPDVTSVERRGEQVVVTGVRDVITDVVLALDKAGVRAQGLRVDSSSLDQAFIELTDDAERTPGPEGQA